MRRVARSWRVIEGVLKENARSAYEALRPPAPMAGIRKLEELVGVKLPRALVSSLLTHDGMRDRIVVVDLYDYNRLISVAEMAKWWRIVSSDPSDLDGPRFFHGRRIKGDLRWRRAWVPIAVDAGGNLLACDLDPGPAGTRSQVFPWQNYGSPPPRVVAPSYAAWLDAVAEEMAARRFTLDEWGGLHLRKRLG